MTIDVTNSYDQEKIVVLKDVWNKIIHHLAQSHDHKKLISFLGKSAVIDILGSEKKITIGVPNSFVMTQIKKFLGKDISKSVQETYESHYTTDFVIFPPFQEADHPLHLPIAKELGINTKKTTTPTLDKRTTNELTKHFGILFDRQYTFNTLVVGAHNQMAASVAQAIANQPGEIYNPFFIYGNVGLGKTHLMQAIGNKIIEQFADKVVIYLPTSKLVNEIIAGIRNNKLTQLLAKLEQVDVLLLDDIQFIAKKEKTQEIFHNIFNDFHMNKKQIIISSDRPPKELNNIADRLKSRFSLGMISDIAEPDMETRVAILQSKAEQKSMSIDDALLEIIATYISSNVRELEGALNIIVTKAQLTKQPITPQDVYQCLHTLGYKTDYGQDQEIHTANTRLVNNLDDIVQIVASYYHITSEEVKSESRKKQISLARKICMKIAKEEFGRTLEKIGEYFGGKNHATVIYSIDSLNKDLQSDLYLVRDWEFIQQKIEI